MSGSIFGQVAPIIDEIGFGGNFPTFRTIGVPLTGLCLYTLSIRAPGIDLLPFITYTFGLSPEAVRKEFISLAGIYDTMGGPVNLGVTRQVDFFGFTPVGFTIEGTTGWKYHSTDGYTQSGMEAMQNLLSLLNTYAALNQQQAQLNDPNLFTLEFYDYFRGDFWQVVPVGPQGVYMSAQAPILQQYRFTFAGIRPVAAPIIDLIADPILTLFSEAASIVTNEVQNGINSMLGFY